MNNLRLINGVLLSFVFLSFFSCAVFGVQYNLGGYLKSNVSAASAASLADSVNTGEATNNTDQPTEETVQIPAPPDDTTPLPMPSLTPESALPSVSVPQTVVTSPVSAGPPAPASPTPPPLSATEKPKKTPEEAPVKSSGPKIYATSAISVESNLMGDSKVIFSKAESTKLPIASITKLMSAIVVLDNFNLSDKIAVSPLANSMAPINNDVSVGDMMPVESFLYIMLIESSNKSAYALAESVGVEKFVDLMNNKSKEIGLLDTNFVDPTGLSSRDISTAHDLSELAVYILKNYPKIVSITSSEEYTVPGFGKIKNTDSLLNEIPDAVCSKTGFTPEAKGCLLLAINNQKNNNYLINIILGANDRFSEMKKLIKWSNASCN